ncbi:MAG: histidine--tRNA ligase [Gluconacetobacter diazotrophicus]|nr:histidine--tRNA ligase [Gluconacetobacter diazotrophicus]
MPDKLQPVRGMRDLLPGDQAHHLHVVDTARRVAALYGFAEWSTPILEDTRVFSRSLGETSDVVAKEMYTFADRDGDSLTLRPEGTAAVCRALVNNGLTQTLPQKVFYAGPMFRHERPQAGRYRQFHQIGAELMGPSEPLADAELIAMARAILDALGLRDGITLELNTLGDTESRAAWTAALVEHFGRHRDSLSEDSRARLDRNPLRILDSKAPRDRSLVAEAPSLDRFLTDSARRHWDDLRARLAAFGVPFTERPAIVRGLDYYGHTVFEFTTDRLGAQGTVLAGGRYDGLVAEMGGPSVPSVGFAAGVERLAMLSAAPPAPAAPVVVVPMAEAAQDAAIAALQALRAAGIRAETAYRGNVRRRMEGANRLSAPAAVLIGEDELARNTVQLKDLRSGEQRELPLADLVRAFGPR